MPNGLCPSLQKCSMAPAECGVWQMRVNGLTSAFCLVYLDISDCSNGIGTTVLPFQAI